MYAWRSWALVGLLAAIASGPAGNSRALASGKSSNGSPPTPTPAGLVSIRAPENGLVVTVRGDGTLAAASMMIGKAEQFELYDLGGRMIALRSVANGKFVSARALEPLRAKAADVGAEQVFHSLGRPGQLVRLRSPAAREFVCVSQRDEAVLAATKRCPHNSQLLQFEPVQTAPAAFEIRIPEPGTVLTANVVNFQWDAGADEYWLTVGSVPGASDIYSSGTLGSAHTHTAAGLPLSGQTLYVRVSRRIGTIVDHVDAEYTAAIRKGLAIITDFENRRLEDWTGPGFQSVDDLRAQLDEMERHWEWLSRDLEDFRWDIIRVQLPHRAVPEAYPGWTAFREAVVALAREQVRVSDYDANDDGVIDAAWSIVSSGLESVPFAIGGASGSGGACIFVDGQASGSVQAQATGNFNHELGHCLGVPDMYGTYSTLNKLTVMNDSWALPPQDFSAYERVAFGWVEPEVIRTSRSGVWLPSANQQLAAVMVPTVRPAEYFLIEFRDPPRTGYGSATQGYRGLAVYHVLAGSSMWQDPPLVKLEPADGEIAPNQALDPNDFISPENPELRRPFVVRSYYDDRDEIFRIDNVVWRDDGLTFDIVIVPQSSPTPSSNLLLNGSFETGQAGTPEAWTPGWYVPQDASFVWPEPNAVQGVSSASLQSVSGNDIRWSQFVATTPGEHYQLCGYLKGESAGGMQGDVAANVSLLGGFVRSDTLSGTFDWTRACVSFTADASRVEVACRLGFYGSTAAGKVWCDDFTLEHIRLHSAFGP
jgi:hypothetical protein